MFHACVQRFDGMDEKILGGELNRGMLHYPSECFYTRAWQQACAVWSSVHHSGVGRVAMATAGARLKL